MRNLAKDRGEKISEYGVENVETGEILTFPSEDAIFQSFRACLSFLRKLVRMGGKWTIHYADALN